MKQKRIEIGGDFLLCAALLCYLDRDGLLLWLLLFCGLHELGHCIAVRLLGGRIARLRLSCAGAELKLSAAHPLTGKAMIPVALSGPLVNLFLALCCALLARQGRGPRLYLLAGMNLALGLFNLLPVRWLDGGQIIRAVFGMLRRPGLGELILRVSSVLLSLALLSAGVLLFRQNGNFTLLIAAGWMTVMNLRESRSNQGVFDF